MDITSAALALPILWGTLAGVCLLTRDKAAASNRQLVVPDHVFSNTVKGVAMLMILYHHFRIYHKSDYWYLFGGGDFYIGVSLFFFISGYGLVKSYRAAPRTVPQFLWHRASVLLPMVALCMLFRKAAVPLMGEEFSFSVDIVELFGFYEWFLVAIWVWYVVLIVTLSLTRSRKAEWGMLAVISAALYGTLIYLGDDVRVATLWQRFPVSFALGAAMAGHLEGMLERVQRHALFPAIAAMVVSAGVLAGVFLYGQPYKTFLAGEIVCTLLVDVSAVVCVLMFCVLLLRIVGPSKALLQVGRLSLPVYLLQVPLIKYGIWFNKPGSGEAPNGVLVMLATSLGIVLAAMVLDYMMKRIRQAGSMVFQR